MKRLLLPALLVAALGIAACGTKHDPAGPPGIQHLSLMLDFFPNADHAGIYEALADGEFRRAGLDVTLRVPGDPSTPLKLLAAGKTDLAISYEPEMLLARDQGAKLVSIGALVQRPLTSIISLNPKFRSPADLEHHTVGTAGIPYQSAYLKTTVQHDGGDPSLVKEVNVGFNLVPAMLSKKVYATLGGFWNYEGIQLARKHRHPKIVRVDQAGVPTYDELVIVARQNEVGPQAATLRRFLQALARAHQTLRDHPDQGVQALLKANPDLDPGLQRAAVKATLPAFFPSNSAQPWGWQDPAKWAAYGRWMFAHGLLKRQPLADRAMVDDLLPGQGF
ncbi:MAG: putative hydroxymethylpyrimidine transport system substrate-binding protein [Solirubrobacteraceae bacterium]|nr:putative hydroxymethylpyrimidine transport system substrate-binding protein [Solirubrobacteraceae bacterium]